MDVFEWVEELFHSLCAQDEERMADMLYELVDAAYDGRRQEVEAIYPEMLSFARTRGLPWLEVYARHWYLQVYVTRGRRIRECLPEAVRLLEISSRDETRGCPQSICAVQDLAICYATIDGPGYADEIIAVVDEALARIDPSWPCLDCLTAQKVDALTQDGRAREAVDFFWRQVERAKDAGRNMVEEEHFLARVLLTLVTACVSLGDTDSALKWCKRARPDDDSGRLNRRLLYALIYLNRRDWDRLFRHFPSYEEMRKVGFGFDWATVAQGLVEAGQMVNDWRLGVQIKGLARTHEEAGVLRHAFDVGVIGARLALRRGARCTLEIHLRDLQALLPQLAKPKGADETLEALEAEAAALRKAGPAAGAVDEDDPERLLDRMLGARDGPLEIDAMSGLLRSLEEPQGTAYFLVGLASPTSTEDRVERASASG